MKNLIRIGVCAGVLATVACSGGPTTPTPTTATLTITLDGACLYANPHILSATVWIDGVMAGDVYAGSSFTKTVSIGYHTYEATSYGAYFQQLSHWGPSSVYVGATSGSHLLYCY